MDQLSCVKIRVSDLDRSTAFFCESLGLPLLFHAADACAMIQAGSGLTIGLVPHSGGNTQPTSTVSLCLEAVGSLVEVVQRLRGEGIAVEMDPDRRGPFCFARLLDPDGHEILLSQRPVWLTNEIAAVGTRTALASHIESTGHGTAAVVVGLRHDEIALPRSAIAATIELAVTATTADLFWPADPRAASVHVDYLSDPGYGPLRGEGRVLRQRRSVDAVVEVSVTDASEPSRQVALAVATVVASVATSRL